MAKKKNIKLNKENIEGNPFFVLPIRNTVIFPGVLIPVTIARKNSISLVKYAFEKNQNLVVLTQKDSSINEPTFNDLYSIGCLISIHQLIPTPGDDNTLIAIIEAHMRVKTIDYTHVEDTPTEHTIVGVSILDEDLPLTSDKHFMATHDSIRDIALRLLSNRENPPADLLMTLRSLENAPSLVNYVCSVYDYPIEKKQEFFTSPYCHF